LFGTAAGSPGYSSGIGIYLAGQPSCVNNCSEKESLLPGSGWIGSRIHLAARPAYEQLFGNLHLLPGVPAAPEQLFGQPGRLSGSWAKKKSRKTRPALFHLLTKHITKDMLLYC